MSVSPRPPYPAADVLGVRVHLLDLPRTLAAVETLLRDGRPHQIATVNPEFVVRARRDRMFRRVLNTSDLALVDGIGIALALRLLYGIRAWRVTGADLIPQLARLAARDELPVFLIGAAPGVAGRAAGRLVALAPGLQVAGTLSGSPEPAEDEATARVIRAGGTRLLFVAFGAPAQELWIARNLRNLDPCIAIGVGGAFDYLAGAVRRAPAWMRSAGLEWLYRLLREPWRWRRQRALPIFVYLVLRQGLTRGWRADL